MKPLPSGLIVATLLFAGAARGAEDYGHLAAYVDWTNDYRFTGVSESNRQPTPQGGLHLLAPDDFYAGVFVTGVRFNDYRNTSYETDFYGGKHFFFDNNDVNLELLYGLYPDSAGRPTYLPAGTVIAGYNFFESAASITHSFGALSLGAKVLVEPRPQSHGGLLWSLGGNASYTIRDWLKLSAEATNQWAERGPRGLNWDIGATASIGWQWAFDLRYYATTTRRADCYNTDWCGPALVAKVTYTFLVF
jgi:uncharacterized protein (TIGR02001 family)